MESEEEDVGSFWLTLKKREYIGNWKMTLDRKLCSTRFGRLYGPVLRQTA